jgi:A/G-specific adenine glycosylase
MSRQYAPHADEPSSTTVAGPLLRWFRRTARDLPWRRTRDPYAIWVSEIMLQQTQVETVKPYYERFLQHLPTVESLAAANIDAVLKLWEGLGYYSRARSLHHAAKQVVRQFAGRLPETRDALLSLPGIGPYTAGAIASIAFGRREPLVDGNVSRVLCRLFLIRQDPKQPAVRKRLWEIAGTLLPASNVGHFNQALMELGSQVCVPRGPRCEICPVRRVCRARIQNEQDQVPIHARRRKIPSYVVGVGVIFKRGRILIDKRKPEGLLGGFWEFPGGKKKPGETLEQTVLREVHEELGIEVRVDELIAVVDHAYSHFRVKIHAFKCTYVAGTPRCLTCVDIKWVYPAALKRYAFPAANREIIRRLALDPRHPER